MLKIIPICLVCLVLICALLLSCGRIVCPNKTIDTDIAYIAIFDVDENFIYAKTYNPDKEHGYNAIIKVDGTEQIVVFLMPNQGKKSLPPGYTERYLTQEEFNQLPTNDIGELAKIIAGESWFCPSVNMEFYIVNTTDSISTVYGNLIIDKSSNRIFALLLGHSDLTMYNVCTDDLINTLSSGFELR